MCGCAQANRCRGRAREREGARGSARERAHSALEQDEERAAEARLALQLDAPAVQLGEPAGDEEAEPRPAEAARGAHVDLTEALEDELARLGRNADPFVAHFEREAADAREEGDG